MRIHSDLFEDPHTVARIASGEFNEGLSAYTVLHARMELDPTLSREPSEKAELIGRTELIDPRNNNFCVLVSTVSGLTAIEVAHACTAIRVLNSAAIECFSDRK